MNATQARELTEKARNVDITRIYQAIESAAKKGKDSVQIETEEWKTTNSVDNVMVALQSNGYKVKREFGSDQREGDWDYILVSW